MDYAKIEEPCFVCKCEDELGETRGTQSHPINCGWKVKRENEGYAKSLYKIIGLSNAVNDDEFVAFVKNVRDIATSSLVSRYDIEERD